MKAQMEEILEMENMGKRPGATEAIIINRIHVMEDRISIQSNPKH